MRDTELHINEGKMKYMAAKPAPKTNQPTTLNRIGQMKTSKIRDYNFETVGNLSYLGSKIATDNSYDDEIRAWQLAAHRA